MLYYSNYLLLVSQPHPLPRCVFLVVQAVDKYPVNKIGSHKKYIHMKCGCCKTLFIGCEVIGKSILKTDQ
jgi:hypothetical protein